MSVFEIVIYAIATAFSIGCIALTIFTIYLFDRFGILNDDNDDNDKEN